MQGWRSPRDKWELQKFLELFFGLKVADKAVCKEHSAPLDAIAAAYFGHDSVVVWHGSRGLAGKTTLMAALSAIELLDGASGALLGGSGVQSQRVHEAIREFYERQVRVDGILVVNPFHLILDEPPTTWLTRSNHGAVLRALQASSRSVRGLHHPKLRLDEVDEMDLPILDASLGQPMNQINNGVMHKSQTLMSSTHHYPDGTMTEILKRAKEKGYQVFSWCYRESSVHNGGWLSDEQIEEKRRTIAAHMWRTEYDLQEPAPENRIFDEADIEQMFVGDVFEDANARYYQFDKPRDAGVYVTGIDWGDAVHDTVVVTLRTDILPWRVVAYERAGRRGWPEQVARAEWRSKSYHRGAHYMLNSDGRRYHTMVHDALGVGGALEDYLAVPAEGFFATGKARVELYADLALAVQHHKLLSPKVKHLYDGLRFLSEGDLTPTGHVPDSVAALALAVRAALGKSVPQAEQKRRPARARRFRAL